MTTSFWFRTSLMALVLWTLLYLSSLFSSNLDFPAVVYIFIGVFGLLTIGIHNLLMSANEKSPQRFVTYFMGSVSAKLFLTLIFLLLYLYFNRNERVVVALSVFGTYVVFTTLEVVSLYRFLTGNQADNNK